MAQIHPLNVTQQQSISESITPNFSIVWENLKYDVKKSNTEMFVEKHLLRKKDVQKSKTIFNGLCGEFKCGELSALMGPSGAGKSTLLECLCGKREKGKSGFIGLTGSRKVNVAFIPQQDHFFYLLTVREALMFASKLQNSIDGMEDKYEQVDATIDHEPTMNLQVSQKPKKVKRTQTFHENIVNIILEQLSLENCAEVRISNLSGGQLKRLSIAQELVAKPDVLILDEPTSGLDSSSCFQTVELLRNLAVQTPPIAVIATIHQPSAKVFNLFHRIYVLSVVGKCIFNGPPNTLVNWLSEFELQSPEYSNPADFVIEISYGDYGKERLLHMARAIEIQNESIKSSYSGKEVNPLNQALYVRDCQYSLEHIKVLCHRSFIFLLRDPLSFFFRLFVHVIVGLFMGVVFHGTGREGGCPPDLSKGIKLENIEKLKHTIDVTEDVIYNNLGNLFFALVFSQFQGVVLNVISFPLTILAIKKETSNGWYSAFTYFTGFIIAETPIQIFNSCLFATLVYTLTDQPFETRRYLEFSMLITCLSLAAQGHGLIFGLLFESNLTAAVFVAPASAVPYLLFSGFLLKTEDIPGYLKPFSVMSYVRYGMEGLFIAVYGNLRCGEGTGPLVKMAKDQMKMFMHSIFRIARHALDDNDDYGEEDYSDVSTLSVNLTESVINGLMPMYLDEAEIDADDNIVSYVIHDYKLSHKSYSECLAILLTFALAFRLIAFFIFNRKVNASK